MLKNQSNAMLFTMVCSKLTTAYALNSYSNACSTITLMELRRVKKFIEQCPLKIKRIKLEGFA